MSAVLPGSGKQSDSVARTRAQVQHFFGSVVPGLLAGNREAVRTIDGRCLFDLGDEATGGGKWVVDFSTDPPIVVAGDSAATDCQITLSATDLLEVIDDPPTAQVLAWQGRFRIGGDRTLMTRVTELLLPSSDQENSAAAGYYASLARLIPDPRLTFMNLGYAEEGDDFGWLSESDQPWRYAINLIRRTLEGAPISGSRVLDVGCGRGGPASYIARYLDAVSVTGLDASADAIRFCQQRHPHPNLEFVHGNAEAIPFDDASLDVVLNVESSHCYLNPRRFLSEVARVLKPGGAFCYTDVLGPAEFRNVQLLFSKIPDLTALREADITAQVAHAIDLNRETFAELLLSLTDSTLRNMSLIANLVHTVNVTMYEKLTAGHSRYYVWCIERAGT